MVSIRAHCIWTSRVCYAQLYLIIFVINCVCALSLYAQINMKYCDVHIATPLWVCTLIAYTNHAYSRRDVCKLSNTVELHSLHYHTIAWAYTNEFLNWNACPCWSVTWYVVVCVLYLVCPLWGLSIGTYRVSVIRVPTGYLYHSTVGAHVLYV